MIIALIKENRYFFACFLLFLLAGGILLWILDTGEAILFLSSNRSYFGDIFFKYGTRLGEEHMYLLAIILALFTRYRYSILILLTGLLVIITSFSTKMFFAHDRPLAFFRKLELEDQLNFVDGVQVHMGATSFPSGHTLSAFALFSLLAFLIPWKKWGGLLFFMLALIVGLSRIYLIQHFLKDVYLGATIGLLIAMILYVLQQRITYSKHYWVNRGISRKRYQ